MQRRKQIGFVGLFFISAIASTLIFQNCSKVTYNIQEKETVTYTGVQSRMVTINPTVSTTNSDMKVLFVVDDSYTMSQSQTRLSNALDSLIDPLLGRNVEFKIVSTSGILSNAIDYRTDKKYFDSAGTEITETQANSLANYFVEKTITNLPQGRHLQLAALKNYNQTQFNNTKSKVKTAILNVGVNGSDTEEGFCAALRQLFDTSSSSFFKAGDKAALIFLTDEDDTSLFTACVSKYKQQVSNQPVIFYNYLEQRAKLTLEYQVNRDGIITWIPVTWGVGLPNGQYFNAGAVCNASDVSIATQIITNRGYIVRNVSNCIYEAIQSTRYGADLGDNGSNPNKDLCTSTVVFQGITYTNFYAYVSASNLSAVPGTCAKVIQPANSVINTGIFTSVIESDPASFSAQDLKNALMIKANELFGSGFIYAALIRKNNESCALQAGQAYGTKYEDLAHQLPHNSVVESLCANNFSSVLSQVSQFIVSSVDKSYVVSDLAADEFIVSVAVRRNGQVTSLTNAQYEIVGNTINLTNYALQQGDLLEVSINTH